MKTKLLVSLLFLTVVLHAADGDAPLSPTPGALVGVHQPPSPRVGGSPAEAMMASTSVDVDRPDPLVEATNELRGEIANVKDELQGILAQMVAAQSAKATQGDAGTPGQDGATADEVLAAAQGNQQFMNTLAGAVVGLIFSTPAHKEALENAGADGYQRRKAARQAARKEKRPTARAWRAIQKRNKGGK